MAASLLSDGKLNGKPSPAKTLTLGNLFEDYLGSLPDGCMEANSLYTARIHMRHSERILGKRFAVRELRLADLQGYVRQRAKQGGRRGKRVSPSTIRKELGTLRAIWTWATVTLDRDGFRDIEFRGQYPIGFVKYADATLPLQVELEAFSPFVPLDLDKSTYPATVLVYTVTNTSSREVAGELFGWLENASASRAGNKSPGGWGRDS